MTQQSRLRVQGLYFASLDTLYANVPNANMNIIEKTYAAEKHHVTPSYSST